MKLYHGKGSCSIAVRAALTLAGIDHQVIPVDYANPTDEFLAASPLGKVPALDTGTDALIEGAAINLWIAANNPGAALMPALDTAEGADALRWLLFAYATVHPAWHRAFFTARYVADPAHQEGVRQLAEDEVFRYFELVNAQLEKHAYVAGDQLTLADLYLGVTIHWEGALSKKLTDAMPALLAYRNRVAADPRLVALFHEEFGLYEAA